MPRACAATCYSLVLVVSLFTFCSRSADAQRPFLPDFGDVVFLQPQNPDLFLATGYSAYSVELNRRFQFWDSRAAKKQANDALTFRATTVGGTPAILEMADGRAAYGEFRMDAVAGQVESGTELFAGMRTIVAGRGEYFFDFGGHEGTRRDDRQMDTLLVGPNLGASSTFAFGRFSVNARLASMFGYQHGNYIQHGVFGEDLSPSKVNSPLYVPPRKYHNARSTNSLSYSAEWKLSASYSLTEDARLTLAYTNVYLNDLLLALDLIDYALYDASGQLLGSRRNDSEGSIWLDSLQLSFVVVR